MNSEVDMMILKSYIPHPSQKNENENENKEKENLAARPVIELPFLAENLNFFLSLFFLQLFKPVEFGAELSNTL